MNIQVIDLIRHNSRWKNSSIERSSFEIQMKNILDGRISKVDPKTLINMMTT